MAAGRHAATAGRILVLHEPDMVDAPLVAWLVEVLAAHGTEASATPVSDFPVPATLVEVACAPHERADWSGQCPREVDVLVASDLLVAAAATAAGLVHPGHGVVISSADQRSPAVPADPAGTWQLERDELTSFLAGASALQVLVPVADLAAWHGLPREALPALLAGALCGSGILDVDAACARGIVAGSGGSQAGTGFDLGLRAGSRPGRLPERRGGIPALVRARGIDLDAASRRELQELAHRLGEMLPGELAAHAADRGLEVLRDQSLAALATYVEELAAVVRALEVSPLRDAPEARGIISDAATSLAALLVVHDRRLLARRLLDTHGAWAAGQAGARAAGMQTERIHRIPEGLLADPTAAADPRAIEAVGDLAEVRPARRADAVRLRRMASHAVDPAHAEAARDLAAEYRRAVIDAIEWAPAVAGRVARSGRLVAGWGPARSASIVSARALWGRVVSQAVAIERASGAEAAGLAARVITAAIDRIAHGSALTLWEDAATTVALAMAHARGTAPGHGSPGDASQGRQAPADGVSRRSAAPPAARAG